MKTKIILLFIISIFFQSCTSYTIVNEKEVALQKGKTYKIMQNRKYNKGKLTNFDEQTLTITHFEKQIKIERSTIEKMKVRKFSVAKTIVFVPVVVVTIAVVGFIADPNINVGN